MAYKAVFIDNGPVIVHYNPYRWPAGSSQGGQFAPSPYGHAAARFNVGNQGTSSTGSSSSSSSGSSTNSGNTSSSSTNSSSTNSGNTSGSSNTNSTGSTSTQAQPNVVNYKRGDPYSMTNQELIDRNTRAKLIDNYNKNYPSAAQQIQDGAQKATQLVNSGAQFAKTFVNEPNYTRLDLSKISNEELARANERARLENQYNQYYNPPKEDRTKEWIDRAAQGIMLGINAAGAVATIVLAAKSKK